MSVTLTPALWAECSDEREAKEYASHGFDGFRRCPIARLLGDGWAVAYFGDSLEAYRGDERRPLSDSATVWANEFDREHKGPAEPVTFEVFRSEWGRLQETRPGSGAGASALGMILLA
jgi:hypothetical protein